MLYPYYDMVPARPIDPPDTPWKCKDCGNTCEAWRCEICRELHCGYDQSGPISVVTLKDGTKKACLYCHHENFDDRYSADLRDAVTLCFSMLDKHSNAERRITIEHVIEALARKICEVEDVGLAEFHTSLIEEAAAQVSLFAPPAPCPLCGGYPTPKVEPWDCPRCAPMEAHNYAAIYVERFGSVPQGVVNA